MFGGGYAHRGTGITSGLATPKRGYVNEPGSYAGDNDYDEFSSSYVPKDTEADAALPPMNISGSGGTDVIQSLLKYPMYRDLFAATLPERKELSRKELMLEPWMAFFSNLGKPTFKKGFGAVSENIREAAAAATPAIGKSLEIKRQFEEAGRKEDVAISQMALQKAMETAPAATIKDIPANIFNQMSRSEQEKILGIGPEHRDEQTVKGVPLSIWEKLTKTEQNIILGVEKLPEEKDVKGVPRDIFDQLSPDGQNKLLGISDDVQMVKGIPLHIFNKLTPEDQNKILVPSVEGEKVKGIPIEIWNKFDENEQAIIAGAKSAKEPTVKGIPMSVFEDLSDADKAKFLGISPTAKNLKVTESGENMIATWTVDGERKQEVIGPAPVEGDDKASKEEAAIAEMDGMLGKLKADFPMIENQYKWISPEESKVITQEDIDYIKQRMRNSFAIAATTESRELTLEELNAAAFNEMVNKNINVPIMDRINANANMSGERYKTFEPMLAALETFKPGSLVDVRMALGKLIELIGPENMTPLMRGFMEKLRLGSPASADILSIMSNKQTLAIAGSDALPGNLNLKEFEALQAAGLPLWTTKEGSQIMLEVYKREDDINLAAQSMMGELIQAQKNNRPLIITLPDGSKNTYKDFTEGLYAIERFVDLETSTLVTGSDVMETGDLTNRIQGMNYDTSTLELDDEDTITYGKEKYNARNMLAQGRLKFVGFAEPGSALLQTKPEYAGSAVYMFDTDDTYTREIVEQLKKEGKDTSQYLVGDKIWQYWKP